MRHPTQILCRSLPIEVPPRAGDALPLVAICTVPRRDGQ
jgi:hypothetical protein